MDARAPLLLALAVCGLQGCERAPPTTVVIPPRASLPDGAAPRPPANAAPPAAATRNAGDVQGAQLLSAHTLLLPVLGVAAEKVVDNFEQGRAGHMHEAIDIMAPAGTAVVAVDDGRIAKLFTSREGGLTVYQFDRDGRLAFYYAHLQAYAPGLREGMDVKRGEAIGAVGSSGNANANAPHLHFAVFRLGSPAKWWEGDAVNPYPALRHAAPAELGVASR
jgi:murein DD-endopeptidase MepM/ murein hydrolase activator NlpD